MDVEVALENIRSVAERNGGVARLAEEAGLPYTTVHAFTRKPLEKQHNQIRVFERLAEAAAKLSGEAAA